jgi:hypothetical protein
MANKREFEFFGWDEDPIGKYKQPKKNPYPPKQGYPVDDTDRTGTMTYGRYMDGKGERKKREDIRGCKNTQHGKRFYVDEEIRPTAPPTQGKRGK